jgi:hypothetical protein
VTTYQLKALVNTVIKQSNIDSSEITDPTQKFSLEAGDKLAIENYKSAPNSHWELELTAPINGIIKWFAFIPHVIVKTVDVSVADLLEEIKNSTFKVYHQPTEQDKEGLGIYPHDGVDGRSERIYPTHVLGPRRQVDSLVRQLSALLPTQDTAFIIAERFVQFPEEHLATVSKFNKAVLVQSFVGIGKADEYPDWAKARHQKELWRLEQSIRLLQAKKLQIVGVVSAMGDSSSHVAKDVQNQIEKQLYQLLDKYDLPGLKQPITWGADELIAMAIAQTLPTTKVRIRIANNDTQLWYDALRSPHEVLSAKLPTLGLQEVELDWDFEVAILTRRKDGIIKDYQANDSQQTGLDREFLKPYKNYSSEQRQQLVIIDGRLFNGAWNADSVLPYSDLLAFGSWGTFGNAVGSTLAAAKVLFHAQNLVAQKQLYLEAVAHDIFANGYAEAQRAGFKVKLQDDAGITFNHYQGYGDIAKVRKVFEVLNQYVNQRMQAHFAGNSDVKDRIFRFTPQLWRTFESEVHLWPRLSGEVHKVGIYRTDLDAIAFNPSSSGALA